MNYVPTSNSTPIHDAPSPQNDNSSLDDSNNTDDEYEWSPPRHVYALREIIVEKERNNGGNAVYDVEEGQLFYDAREDDIMTSTAAASTDSEARTLVTTPPRAEAPPDDVAFSAPPTKAVSTPIMRRTRIISSQMINISREDNAKLVKMSRGAVLCARWIEEERYVEEGEDESKNVETASENVRTLSPSPPQVRVCTTTSKDNIEEHVAVVPYPMARRRMGCNCHKTAEDDEEATTNRKLRPLKAAYTIICRSVKRSLLRQLKREHSNNNKAANEKVEEDYCKECNFFGENPVSKKPRKKKKWMKRRRRKRRNRSSLTSRNVGATIYGDEAVLGNTAAPINDILTIDSSQGIYICETGLTAVKCQEIINAAECLARHKGAWSAYTYAKQTLGCKEYDDLAEACEEPVMTACATVRDRLEYMWAVTGGTDESGSSKEKEPDTQDVKDEPEGGNIEEEPVMEPKKELVLDTREPHVVKYDISRSERRKLDMHTDRSVWTFIIALSEGRGQDFAGGGTFFEKLNATVHLQRGQMIIFRGRQRHRGVKILYGKRYLLVGFLVEQKSGGNVMKKE
ncbi:hypothetical protein ACHAWT_002569 [Skeletonema menzelii]